VALAKLDVYEMDTRHIDDDKIGMDNTGRWTTPAIMAKLNAQA
jgi:hypothetical protein